MAQTTQAGRSWGRRYAVWALAAAVPLLLAAALAAVVATPWGLQLARPLIAEAIAGAVGGSATIAGLDGTLWRGVTAKRIEVRASDGLDVAVDGFRLDWRPAALLHRVLRVDVLAADRVAVILAQSGSSEVTLPQLPVAVRLGRIDVGELAVRAAPGAAAKRVAIHGDLALSPTDVGTAALHLRPLQKTGDKVDATATLDPNNRTLDLSIDATAPADGMLWQLAGVPPAQAHDTRLTLSGHGPFTGWQGELKAEATGLGRLDSKVSARLGDDNTLHLGLDGEAVPVASALPPPLAGVVRRIGLRLDARLHGTARAEVSTLALDLGDAGTLRASGTADLAKGTVDATAEADVAPAMARRVAPGVSWQSAHLKLHAKGPLAAPVPTLDVTLGRPAGFGLAADEATLHLAAADAALAKVSARLQGHGVAWGDPALDRLLGPRLEVTAAAGRHGDTLAVSKLTLAAGGLSATAAADLGIASQQVSNLTLSAHAERLGELSMSAGVVARGSVEAHVSDGQWSPATGFDGTLRIAGRDLALAPAAAKTMIGAAPTAEGRLTVSPAGAVTVRDLKLTAAGGKLAGRASLDAGRKLDLSLDGTLAPAPLGRLAGVVPDAPPTVSLSLAGPLAQPAGDVKVSWRRLQTPGSVLGAGRVTTRLAWKGDVPTADVEAAVGWRGRQLTASAHVAAEPAALAISGISLKADGMQVSGAATLAGYALPATGKLRLDGVDLKLLRPLLGEDLGGTVSGTATLAARNGGQAVDLQLDGGNLSRAAAGSPTVSIGKLQVSGQIEQAVASPHGKLRVVAETVQRGAVTVTKAEADLAGGLDAATVDFHVDAGEPAGTLDGRATLARDGGGRRLTLTRFSGTLAGRSFQLAEPATLALPAGGGIDLAAALKTDDNGRLRVAYRTGGMATVVTVEVTRFPLALLPPLGGRTVTKGTLQANVHLEQPAGGEATGTAKVSVDKLALKSTEDLPPLSGTLTASLRRGRLDTSLKLDVAALDAAQATAKLPVDVSLTAGRLGLAKTGAVDGSAELRGSLQKLWAYLPLPTHKLSGSIDASATVHGSIRSPQLAGRIKLDGGRYESLEWGTLLRNVTLDARFTDSRLQVDKFTADDGKGGRVSVSGSTRFGGGDGPRYDLTAKADNLTVLRRDDVSARASADLTFTGAGKTGKLAGKVTVTGGEVDLAAALPPSVPTLEVTRASADAQAAEEAKPASAGDRIALDVTVDIPGQFYARGRGVQSEWQGNLQVEGTLATPKVYGRIGVRRGTLSLLSRELQLGDTVITFQGRTPVSPDLAVRAVYTGQDLRAVIQVDGTATAPKFSLTSTPTLPQDEIMARMLFGKSRGKLSPVEAAQVAAALDQLRGGGGLDVLGTIRSFVGLDRLSVGTAQNGNAELQAGRYIGRNVYVGAVQGTAPGTAGVQVQVDVTPHVTVNSQTGQDGNSNVGVNFKLDY